MREAARLLIDAPPDGDANSQGDQDAECRLGDNDRSHLDIIEVQIPIVAHRAAECVAEGDGITVMQRQPGQRRGYCLPDVAGAVLVGGAGVLVASKAGAALVDSGAGGGVSGGFWQP